MGLLVVFFIGIAVIIVIAKMASKMRPEEERIPKKTVGEDQSIDDEPDLKETLDALIAILTRKEILNPDELLIEIAANRKHEQ